MKTNKMLPDSSISKVWENFRKMNGIVIEFLANNWVSQNNGTFTNTVFYEGFTSDEILEIDLYDDGTLTETQISEYDGYITELNVEDGKIVAVATTLPTQTIKILARGEIVGKMVMNGGSSSNISASNVSCLDKDGQTSNVQKELDEQNKNLTIRYNAELDIIECLIDGEWVATHLGKMKDITYGNGNTGSIFSGVDVTSGDTFNFNSEGRKYVDIDVYVSDANYSNTTLRLVNLNDNSTLSNLITHTNKQTYTKTIRVDISKYYNAPIPLSLVYTSNVSDGRIYVNKIVLTDR